jgi:hypothetical protein
MVWVGATGWLLPIPTGLPSSSRRDEAPVPPPQYPGRVPCAKKQPQSCQQEKAKEAGEKKLEQDIATGELAAVCSRGAARRSRHWVSNSLPA